LNTQDSHFAPTRWSRVLDARGDAPEARAALSDLCAAYYAPVLAFLRRERGDEEVARELAHEFFRTVARRQRCCRGRSRARKISFVSARGGEHFLGDRRDHELRQKRGAGATHESLDAGTDSAPGLAIADANALPPDVLFDRQWALTLLDRAFNSLEAELSAEGKAAHLEVLKPWLVADADRGAQADAAAQLGVSETAVRVIVHRLRQRYREAVRAELRQTLAPGASVEEELQCLFAALAA
jgi:RNA polymerase sigma-70 factor (ECF subfamily)